MRLKITLAAVSILALVVVAASFAGTNASAVKASAATAKIKCGTTRTIGVGAPITGPAASIGQQQLRWAQFYVKNFNALKANAKRKIAIVQGDTQLGVDTAFAVKVAQSFASNPKVLGVVGLAGSQENAAATSVLQGGGLGWISGSATRVSLTDGRTDGVNRQGFFFRSVPNDGIQGPTVANYIRLKIKATKRLHHRRPGVVLAGARRQRPGEPQGSRPHRDPRLRQPGHHGLLLADREDPEQHGSHLHPVAALASGPGVRAAAQGRRQEHHAVRLRRAVRPVDVEDHGLLRLVLPGRHRVRRREGLRGRSRRRRRVLRCADLRRDAGAGRGDHQGVRGWQRNSRGGAQVHRSDEHPGSRGRSSASGSSSRRPAISATAGSACSRSSPTARTSASGSTRS